MKNWWSSLFHSFVGEGLSDVMNQCLKCYFKISTALAKSGLGERAGPTLPGVPFARKKRRAEKQGIRSKAKCAQVLGDEVEKRATRTVAHASGIQLVIRWVTK